MGDKINNKIVADISEGIKEAKEKDEPFIIPFSKANGRLRDSYDKGHNTAVNFIYNRLSLINTSDPSQVESFIEGLKKYVNGE